jgi:hypothetical protein
MGNAHRNQAKGKSFHWWSFGGAARVIRLSRMPLLLPNGTSYAAPLTN